MVGSCLSEMFESWGFKPCNKCKALAANMDKLGPEECMIHADWLAGQIISNAKSKGIPSIPIVSKYVVVKCIERCCEKTSPGILNRMDRKALANVRKAVVSSRKMMDSMFQSVSIKDGAGGVSGDGPCGCGG